LFSDYAYYFQFSLTPYGKDVEGNLPDKHDIIKTFKELSMKMPARIGYPILYW
ncbi:MAG: DUF1848 family protein, partial [Deferribacteraceae bacterium]|nr:DUF1848 family protein [Deferribacteraceae bacterium]